MDRIKRLSYDVLEKYKSKFGENFSDNKKALGEVTIIRSKGLKNEIAGYITKFIKKEIRDMKTKQAQIDAITANESAEQKFEETEDGAILVIDEPENVSEQAPEQVSEQAPDAENKADKEKKDISDIPPKESKEMTEQTNNDDDDDDDANVPNDVDNVCTKPQ